MSDVLDQSQVDTLLATEAPSGRAVLAPQAHVRAYDFRQPPRAGDESTRALAPLCRGFARQFSAALSGHLRTAVEIAVGRLDRLTYGEFLHSLPQPTCLIPLKSESLDNPLCLEISLLMIYPMIDRLLGGSNPESFMPLRPLTQIEQRLAQRLADLAAEHLSDALGSLSPAAFKAGSLENDPQPAQLLPSDQAVLVASFELKMDDRAGAMLLCIPYTCVEPMLEQLARKRLEGQNQGPADERIRPIHGAVRTASVELRGLLVKTTIRRDDLLALQPGDVITTSAPVDPEAVIAVIQVAGKDKFLGRMGQFRRKRAVQITRLAPPPPAAGGRS